MRPTVLHIVIVLTVACLLCAFAQTAPDEFERGNTFYRNGNYDQAAASYESILKQGLASSSLYFNLGNCYYRTGKLAPAIVAYERALRLQPNDADTKHNLALLNLKTLDRIEPLPEIFFIEWLRSFSAVVPLHTTTQLFAACWVLLFASLSLFYLLTNQALLRLLRGLAIVSALALIPVTIVVVTQMVDSGNRTDAIITASVVTAKTSPDSQSVDAFVAHEGLKVKLSDAVGEWMKIVLPDGKVGWIRSQDCERI
jgi:tetratricopeptide (TPR) repeat protein